MQGQSGCFIASDVFPLVVLGIEEVKSRQRERDRESVPSALVYTTEWESGTAGAVKRCHCLIPAWGKRTCFMPSISLNCFHVREFSFDVSDCVRVLPETSKWICTSDLFAVTYRQITTFFFFFLQGKNFENCVFGRTIRFLLGDLTKCQRLKRVPQDMVVCK